MNRYRVQPGDAVNLSQHDPADTSAFDGDKGDGKDLLDSLTRELEMLQEMLFAENKHKLLIMLQGMDTSGKDGTIRHVFEGVNPQGVKVTGFKAPTQDELSHDYLWRVHRHVPGKGEIVIFNRSHYEDVLVVRVNELVPRAVWQRRYDQINHFEKLLVEEGTTILKFYLHISKQEQKERLMERLQTPEKQWKFNLGDLETRTRWDEYFLAYQDMLTLTSTEWAPWYIIPADKKWYRNLVVGSVLVRALKGLEIRYPLPKEDISGVVID